MKTTGIVRRVDDLGRIVIPREFRRAYDINIGDPLEITADENGVISLKRVGFYSDFKRFAESAAEFLAEQDGWTALVCDRTRYIAGKGKYKGNFIDRETPMGILQIISSARPQSVSGMELGGEKPCEAAFAYICPINDVKGPLGGLIVLSDDAINDADAKVITLSARLVSNNMQKY